MHAHQEEVAEQLKKQKRARALSVDKAWFDRLDLTAAIGMLHTSNENITAQDEPDNVERCDCIQDEAGVVEQCDDSQDRIDIDDQVNVEAN